VSPEKVFESFVLGQKLWTPYWF